MENNQAKISEYITLIKRENELLKRENAILKENMQKIKKGVASFVERADIVQAEAKQSLNQNILRLKVYELKLISYYNKVVQKYPIDEDLSNISEFIKELKNVVNKDFFSREDFQIYADSKQLTKRSISPLETMVPNESGFDFFEAMHPDKDLAELCMELGLMSDSED
ncbi:MAG: hypothetical protein R3Y32_03765 [Bacillota bacterium]